MADSTLKFDIDTGQAQKSVDDLSQRTERLDQLLAETHVLSIDDSTAKSSLGAIVTDTKNLASAFDDALKPRELSVTVPQIEIPKVEVPDVPDIDLGFKPIEFGSIDEGKQLLAEMALAGKRGTAEFEELKGRVAGASREAADLLS